MDSFGELYYYYYRYCQKTAKPVSLFKFILGKY